MTQLGCLVVFLPDYCNAAIQNDKTREVSMDIAPIFKPLLGMLWYLIPLMILVVVLKSAWFKGAAGEFMVNLGAKLLLDKDKYHLIKNVTLPTENGSTQIDHVIVSTYGVFAVETKNMSGWIYGGAHQKTWTQKIYKHSSKFQNPLHQNYKHTKTLESLLGLNDEQIHSVVVFVGDSTFKTDMPENVTTGMGYIEYIKTKNKPVLTEYEVADITRKIENGRFTPSFKTSRNHVKHVKNIIEQKDAIRPPSCPKCGAPMILRVSKKVENADKQFWGCSSFPKCRGVINAKDNAFL